MANKKKSHKELLVLDLNKSNKPTQIKNLHDLKPQDISPYSLTGTGFDGKNISWVRRNGHD